MKKLSKLLGLALSALMMLGLSIIPNKSLVSVRAVDADYTLATTAGTNNSYAGNCDITVGGIVWNVNGNSLETPWRLGGKSITDVERTVYSKTAYQNEVSKIVLTVGSASSITVNSLKLLYSTNSDFSSCTTINGTFVESSDITFTPSSSIPANSYFKFVFNLTVSSTKNKYVEFSGVKIYNKADASAPTISISTNDSTSIGVNDTITFIASHSNAGDNPTISYSSSNVEIATLNGNVLTAVDYGDVEVTAKMIVNSVEYKSDPIKVRVIASNGSILTCKQANNLANQAGGTASTNSYTVNGYVKEITTAYDSTYSNLTFVIEDDTGTFIAYRAANTSTTYVGSNIVVGMKISVTGNVLCFNSICEFNAGCTYVYYPALVTFVAGDNAISDKDSVSSFQGCSISLPEAVHCDSGYTFCGWYTEAEGGTLIGMDGDPYKVSSDISLYAHYTVNSKLDTPTNIRVDNKVLKWNEVANAVSYDVTWSKDTDVDTINVNVNELSLVGFDEGTYTFVIEALPDSSDLAHVKSECSSNFEYELILSIHEKIANCKTTASLNFTQYDRTNSVDFKALVQTISSKSSWTTVPSIGYMRSPVVIENDAIEYITDSSRAYICVESNTTAYATNNEYAANNQINKCIAIGSGSDSGSLTFKTNGRPLSLTLAPWGLCWGNDITISGGTFDSGLTTLRLDNTEEEVVYTNVTITPTDENSSIVLSTSSKDENTSTASRCIIKSISSSSLGFKQTKMKFAATLPDSLVNQIEITGVGVSVTASYNNVALDGILNIEGDIQNVLNGSSAKYFVANVCNIPENCFDIVMTATAYVSYNYNGNNYKQNLRSCSYSVESMVKEYLNQNGDAYGKLTNAQISMLQAYASYYSISIA